MVYSSTFSSLKYIVIKIINKTYQINLLMVKLLFSTVSYIQLSVFDL